MARITFSGWKLLRATQRFEEGILEKVSDIVFETARLIQT